VTGSKSATIQAHFTVEVVQHLKPHSEDDLKSVNYT